MTQDCPIQAEQTDLSRQSLPGFKVVLGIFLLVFGVQTVVQWPLAQSFALFGFYDPGSALKADWLLAKGLRPTIDFAYAYGLLSLLVGHGWFGIM